MIETGLTDREKESLLKFFLTNGALEIEDGKYIWKFYKDYTFLPIENKLPELIAKAHRNLTMSALDILDEIEHIDPQKNKNKEDKHGRP